MQESFERKNFFAKLFDLSFKDFITPSVVSVLYVGGIIVIGIASIAEAYSIGSLFSHVAARTRDGEDLAKMACTIVLSPCIFFPSLIALRIWLELFVALVRIAQNTTDMNRLLSERPMVMGGVQAPMEAESPPADLLERARWLHERGRSDEAILVLKEKVTVEPNSIQAHDLMAVLYEQKRDYQGLLQVLNKLTALDPSNVKYMEHMARVMKLAQGDKGNH